MKNRIALAALMAMTASPAFAGEPCQSAKDMVNMAQAFYGDNPKTQNIVTPTAKIVVEGINDQPIPSHMMYRYEGVEHRLPIVDGELTSLETAATWSKDGEMCRLIEGELAPTVEGDSTSVNVSFMFPYKRQDGLFSMDEILEGAKDGSKVMSKLAPSGLGFVVPKLKTIGLSLSEGSDQKPTAIFTRNGDVVSVASYFLDGVEYFRLKDIKSSKADALKIEGGYVLSATFKIDPDEIVEAEAKRLAELTQPEN